MFRCFDKRVLIGLGALAAAGFLVAPKTAVAALPVLIALACPLSMLVMMRGMRAGSGTSMGCSTGPAPGTETDTGSRDGELASLRAELAELKAARAGRGQDVEQPAPLAKASARDTMGDRHDVTG